MSNGTLMEHDDDDGIMDEKEDEDVGATESRREEPVCEYKVVLYPSEPFDKEIEMKKHLEDIDFTMLEDNELLELGDSIGSYACVDCVERNTCVVCAEISAYMEGDGFGNAVSEDCAEVKATPVILSTCLSPPIVKQPMMEFKPLSDKLEYASLTMKGGIENFFTPVQDVEPHFCWEDFVDKEVISDPEGIEKFFTLEEVTMIFERSLSYLCCKLCDLGINFHSLSITWPSSHKQWDPGGSSFSMSFS